MVLCQGRELNQLIMMMRVSMGPGMAGAAGASASAPYSRQSEIPGAKPQPAYVPYGTSLDTTAINAQPPTTDLKQAIVEESERRFLNRKLQYEKDLAKKEAFVQRGAAAASGSVNLERKMELPDERNSNSRCACASHFFGRFFFFS